MLDAAVEAVPVSLCIYLLINTTYKVHCCVLIVTTGEAWLPQRCSPCVVCLYPSLYIVLPILLLYRHDTMPELLSAGQPSFWRGPTSVLPGGRSMNIVQRLGHRALTGRGLGVTIHQHYGYRIHFELRGEFGSRSFERRFCCNRTCERFCISIIRGYPEGLCVCMLVREGFSPRTSWHYAGRYEPLCAAGAFRYTPTEPGVKSWTPRQIKAIDEAVWRLCLRDEEGEEGDLPQTDVSRWCGCTITSRSLCE